MFVRENTERFERRRRFRILGCVAWAAFELGCSGADSRGSEEREPGVDATEQPLGAPAPPLVFPPSTGGSETGGSATGGGATGGAASGGAATGGSASGGSASGGSGGTIAVDAPRTTSMYCGDGVRDPETEECDDGIPSSINATYAGTGGFHAGSRWDVCSDNCQVRDVLLVNPSDTGTGGSVGTAATNGDSHRRLGTGHHPIAGSVVAFASSRRSAGAVAWLSAHPEPQLFLELLDASGNPFRNGMTRAFFTDRGQPGGRRTNVGIGADVPLNANAVVAGFPDGGYVVAFNDLNGDGAGLGVALRRVNADGDLVGFSFANSTTVGAQQDADLLWTGSELVAAWTDLSDDEKGPDVRIRRFDGNFLPVEDEKTLANGPSPEGGVSLAAAVPPSGAFGRGSSVAPSVGAGLVAAYRESETSGAESIVLVRSPGNGEVRVKVQPSTTVSGGPNRLGPGAEGDRLALAGLDDDHAFVAFSAGTDPTNSGVKNVFRLYGAVVRFSTASVLEFGPIAPLLSDLAADATRNQRSPSVVAQRDIASGRTEIFLAWQSGSALGNVDGEDNWLKRIDWKSPVSGSYGYSLALTEVPLNRSSSRVPTQVGPAGSEWMHHGLGDQRVPALALLSIDGPRTDSAGLPQLSNTSTGSAVLGVVWEDWGRSFKDYLEGDFRKLDTALPKFEEGEPDIALQLAPLPLRRGPPVEKTCTGGLCGLGEGPCSVDAECGSSLVCLSGRGPWYGFGAGPASSVATSTAKFGVCGPAHCRSGVLDGNETSADCGGSCGKCFTCPTAANEGTANYCSLVCPCAAKKGDCDSTDDCQSGLECVADSGVRSAFPKTIDLCLSPLCSNSVLDSGETRVDCGGPCGICERGTIPFCSAASPCTEGDGSCEADNECTSGLRCSTSQEQYYSLPSGTGVCVASGCPEARGLPTDSGFCSTSCRCPDGLGTCTSDAQCLGAGGVAGKCVPERGLYFGLSVSKSVCQPATCANGVKDGSETTTDCGGVCGSECPACLGLKTNRSFEFAANSSNAAGSRGFEYAGASGGITWSKVTGASEGAEAIRFAGCGFTRARGPSFKTSEFEIVGDTLLLDVRFRTNSGSAVPTDRYLGNYAFRFVFSDGSKAELYAGDFRTVGPNLSASIGTWQTLSMTVPAPLLEKFKSGLSGVRLEVDLGFNCSLSDPLSLDLDNLRFRGNAVFQSLCSTNDATLDSTRNLWGFETSSSWTSPQVTITTSTTKSEGSSAIQFSAVAATLTSSSFPLRLVDPDDRLLVDLMIPSGSGNATGSVSASLSCPSVGIVNHSLGTTSISGGYAATNVIAANKWHTIPFTVPTSVRAALESGAGSCTITLGTQFSANLASGLARLDNLRFGPGTYCNSAVAIDAVPFAIYSSVASAPTGSVGSPYRLCGASQIQGIVTNSLFANSYSLEQDIDLSSVAGSIGNGTTAYSGTFNGNGFELSNFQLNTPANSHVGFFGRVTGSVSNLKILNFNVVGASYVGALAGSVAGAASVKGVASFGANVSGTSGIGGVVGRFESTGVLENLSSRGNVSGTGSGAAIGGLVGQLTSGTLRSSTVSGVTSTTSSNSVGGAVGDVAALVESVLSSSEVAGVSQVGGLAGYVSTATGIIRNSSANGRVSSSSAYVGGLVGVVGTSGKIQRSAAAGAVVGATSYGGGLVGSVTSATIEDSYSRSSVTLPGSNVGGLLGTMSTSTVKNSYATGAVSGASNRGTIVGNLGTGTFVAALGASAGNTGLNPIGNQTGVAGTENAIATQFLDLNTFTSRGWDTNFVWKAASPAPEFVSDVCTTMSLSLTAPFVTNLPVTPTGVAAKPYPLCNAYQVQTVIDTPSLWGASFALLADIDLAGVAGSIGNRTTPFTGTFDGRNWTLRNFTAVGSPNEDRGLFGVMSGATVKNLKLQSFSISGLSVLGSLAGEAISSTLDGISSTSPVIVGTGTLGGLVGKLSGGSVTASSVVGGSVAGTSFQLGGFVGFSSGLIGSSSSSASVVLNEGANNGDSGAFVGINIGSISGSSATGNIQANWSGSTASTIVSIGGFVGQNGTSAGPGSILTSTATGSVIANAAEIGGFVGTQATTGSLIESCQSSGLVDQNDTAVLQVGGFAGRVSGGTIRLSTTSSVTDSRYREVGGFVGRIEGSGTLIERSAATGTARGAGEQIGGFVGRMETGTLIRRSSARGNVTSETTGYVGGFVGWMISATVDDSYARGTATGATQRVGGFAGRADTSTISRTYANGVVTVPTSGGRFVGYVSGTTTITGSLTSSTVNTSLPFTGTGSPTLTNSTSVTQTQLETQTTYTSRSWNFTTIWVMGTGGAVLL